MKYTRGNCGNVILGGDNSESKLNAGGRGGMRSKIFELMNSVCSKIDPKITNLRPIQFSWQYCNYTVRLRTHAWMGRVGD